MKRLLLTIVALSLVASAAHATGRQRFVQKQVVRQQFVVQKQVNRQGLLGRFRGRNNQKVVQQFVVPAHIQQIVVPAQVQQFVVPVPQVQQFVVPSYGVKQFVAPQKVQQFNSGGHQGCRAMLGH